MRVGTICYATEQGIGYLPKDFYDNGVITDVMVYRHGSRTNHLEWYPEDTVELVGRPFDGPIVEAWLRKLDVLFQVETPFDWKVMALAKKLGVRTAIMPMYECTPRNIPVGCAPDRWLCPSKLDVSYFKGPFVPVPVAQPWHKRGRVWKFLHNGGNLGLRGHKGTKEILQAWELCKKPVDLTVRAQDTAGLRRILWDIGYTCPERSEGFQAHKDGKALTVDMRPVKREDLFPHEFDAFVMAEKYNGLSLPIAEARAAGMLVVTSNRFPMNDWLPDWPLIPVSEFRKAAISGAYLEYDEAIVTPQAVADTLDSLHGIDASAYSESGREWAQQNSWEVLKPVWLAELAK